MTLENFTADVIEKLKYYVYRLVDPRNGETFYVGKGCGNRVFEHVRASDSFYNSEALSKDEKDAVADDFAKLKRIKQIKNQDLEVIHIIQRWGLTEEVALEIESSFIDYFSLDLLTNINAGHDGYSMRHSVQLQKDLSTPEFSEGYEDDYIIIKIKDSTIAERNDSIYEAVRKHWRISIENANKRKYVLAVVNGIVREVFEVEKNGWKPSADFVNRALFTGKEATGDIVKHFKGKRIPSRFVTKGLASPILYGVKK